MEASGEPWRDRPRAVRRVGDRHAPTRRRRAALACAGLLVVSAAEIGCRSERSPTDAPTTDPRLVTASPTSAATAGGPPQADASNLLALPEGGACRLVGSKGVLLGPFDLRVAGQPFAYVTGEIDRIDVLLDSAAREGRAVVKLRNMTLGGQVAIDSLMVRPTELVRHGAGLHVRRLRVRGASADGRLSGAFFPPPALSSRTAVSLELPCAGVLLTGSVEVPTDGTPAGLRPKVRAPLRRAPAGESFAEIVGPSGNEGATAAIATIFELERAGDAVKLRLSGPDAWLEGWTDASVVTAGSTQYGILGLLGSGGARGAAGVRCTHDVAAYVRVGSGRVHVGTLSSGADIWPVSPAPVATLASQAEVAVDLGSDPLGGLFAKQEPAPLQPFVEGKALAGCESTPAP